MDYKNVTENARKIHETILNRLAVAGLEPVANLVTVDQSTIQRLKTDEPKINFTAFAMMLDFMGLKVANKDSVSYSPEEIEHLLYWAKKGINAIETAKDLAVNGHD